MYRHSRLERNGFSKLVYSFWFGNINNRSNCIELGYSKDSILSFSIRIKYGSDNDVTIGLSGFFFFYLSFNLPKSWMQKFKDSLLRYEYDREISIAFHNQALWWNFWTSCDSWSSSTPKYRNGSFNILRFLLGNWIVDRKILEEGYYKVYSDTGINDIVIQKELFTKYRDRWYSKWFKFKFFRWNYEYGVVENCKPSDVDCYCRLKGTLHFDYIPVEENYEKLVRYSLRGARKVKWDCDELQGGSFYEKDLKELDKAYLHLVKDIYTDKLKYSRQYYKTENYEK